MSLQLWGPAGRRAGFQTGLAFAPEGLHPAHYGTYGGLNDPGHSLVGMAPLQERHRFGAPRFQLSGSAFGSHEPYYATARTIYPLFMRESITFGSFNALVSAGRTTPGSRQMLMTAETA